MKRLLFAIIAVAIVAGCSSVDENGILRHEQFEVRGSGLDWMEITYIPAPGDPRFPCPARLSLSGSGNVSVKSGISPQVMDDFSTDYSNPEWNSFVSDRVAYTPDQMRAVFQAFVDTGAVATASQKDPDELELPQIAYAGTIGMEKFRYTTDNAPLVELVERALENNFGPLLRKASASSTRTR